MISTLLKDSFREYVHSKEHKSPNGHFTEGGNKHMLLLSDVEPSSFEQSQEIENVDSFGITAHIVKSKVRTDPTSERKSVERQSKSATTDGSNNSYAIREHIRQANQMQAQLNLDEIKLCNEFIEKLKLENANLDLTVTNQRLEILELKGTAE